MNDDNKNNENDIEVVIGDNSELNFSEVEDFVEEIKPKVNSNKKTNIIIPVVKKKNDNKEKNKKSQ